MTAAGRLTALLCLVLAAASPGASAQVPLPSGPTESSDRQRDARDEPRSRAKTGKRSRRPSWRLGRALELELAGRVERDVRGPTPDIGLAQSTSYWQDRRLGVKGTAFGRIGFEVSRELGLDFEEAAGLSEKTPWRDVYADIRLSRALSVAVGQFKLPFSHEELLGETDLDFVYRSRAARLLAPGRDPGVMAHGRVGGRRLEYQAGCFTRDGMNGRTSQTRGGRDACAGRVTIRPLSTRTPRLGNLALGAAVADSRLDHQLGIRGQSVFGDNVFFDRVFVNGQRRRLGWEATWSAGPVGVAAEWMTLSEQRRGMGFSAADLEPVRATGWYVSGTWALTGERKRGRLEPAHPLLAGGPGGAGGAGGLGALELAVRIDVLRFDALRFDAMSPPATALDNSDASQVAGNADHVVTLGLNWYVNHYAKLQANLVRESMDDPQRSPAPVSHGHFASTVLRLQLRF